MTRRGGMNFNKPKSLFLGVAPVRQQSAESRAHGKAGAPPAQSRGDGRLPRGLHLPLLPQPICTGSGAALAGAVDCQG